MEPTKRPHHSALLRASGRTNRPPPTSALAVARGPTMFSSSSQSPEPSTPGTPTPVLSVRIVSIDYYMAPPLPGFDFSRSPFHGALPFLSCSPSSSSSRSPLPRCAEFDSLRVWNARGGGGRGAGRQDLRLHARGPEDLPPHPPGAYVVPAQLLCQRHAPRLCISPLCSELIGARQVP